MKSMHFLTPLKTAHPAGPVTFMNTSISPIDYISVFSRAHSISPHCPPPAPPLTHSLSPCRTVANGQPSLGGIDFKQINTSHIDKNNCRQSLMAKQLTTQGQSRGSCIPDCREEIARLTVAAPFAAVHTALMTRQILHSRAFPDVILMSTPCEVASEVSPISQTETLSPRVGSSLMQVPSLSDWESSR